MLIQLLKQKKLGIPVIALANTNTNPDNIDYILPINNYSIRSIMLILGVLIDAIAEAKDEPTKVVGKADEEIVLPEVQTKRVYNGENAQRAYINHNRQNNNRFEKNKKEENATTSEESSKIEK